MSDFTRHVTGPQHPRASKSPTGSPQPHRSATTGSAPLPARLPRVRATPAANAAVVALTRIYGHLVIVQSSGHDGNRPTVLTADAFEVTSEHVHVGDVANVPVYVSQRELRTWPGGDIHIDVEHGYTDGLSLTPADGSHLVARSTACAPTPEGSQA